MSKALPQGLELTCDGNGLDTVRVSMSFTEALSLLRIIAKQLHPGGDAIVLTLFGWLQKCQDEVEQRKYKARHLRLLEAVAVEARDFADAYWATGISNFCLLEEMETALAELEAYDE